MKKSLPFILIEAVFVGLLILNTKTYGFLDVILLGLAASFVGRAIAYLKIFEWLRAPFSDVKTHWTGGGDDVVPKDVEEIGYFKYALANLICCPICAGTWAACVLTYLPQSMTYVFAASAIAWLTTYLTEYLEWNKTVSRTTVGKSIPGG